MKNTLSRSGGVAQIRAWISEEIAALRAQSTTDADMHEEAFIVLVGEIA